MGVEDGKVIRVGAGDAMIAVVGGSALEFVEDTVRFIEVAEMGSEVVMDLDSADGSVFHLDVPDLEREVVPGYDVSTVQGESHIGNGGNYFGEK